MIVEDCDLIGVNENRMPQLTQHFIRVVPEISSEFTNPKSQHLKAEFGQQIAELSAPIDDPMYVELHGKYFMAILFDFETRSSSKLFRIVAIQFVRSFWEATCEPVRPVHRPFQESNTTEICFHIWRLVIFKPGLVIL